MIMGGCSIFKDLKLDAKVSAHANFKGMSLDGSSEKISPFRHTAAAAEPTKKHAQ
mgnify:CR=1 FL=1